MILTLTRIYQETKNESFLNAAVRKNWITEDEKNLIIASFEKL